ncbi:hypothetical protein GCM10027299_44700 [Larkinella ripae]
MKIRIATTVQQEYRRVWAGFDRTLLEKLSPPFPPVKIVRFDGSRKGDLVHLRLNLLLFSQDWISRIIDQEETGSEIYFIDQGVKLPFFLTYWRHKHRIIRHGDHTRIADEISFRTPTILTDFLIYPIMYGLFAYRKPIYKQLFA